MVQWLRLFPMQGVWVQSLVRELRFQVPCGGVAKKKKERDQQNRCVWLDSEGLGQFTYYVYDTMDSFSGWGTWNSHRQDTMSACSIAYVTNTY